MPHDKFSGPRSRPAFPHDGGAHRPARPARAHGHPGKRRHPDAAAAAPALPAAPAPDLVDNARTLAAVTAFGSLGLAREVVQAVAHAGYTDPSPVQAAAIPPALEGADLLVSARTGSGKTAAFVLPALQRVLQARVDPDKRRAKGQACGPRVLVLAPTRELALQVARAAEVYGRGVQGLRVGRVVGGMPYGAQLKALSGPLDILIATPGRLMDLMQSGRAVLSQVELLVLDEADRMLDMGFIDDIRLIAEALPRERQTMMFSATFDGAVGPLARTLTREPRTLQVDHHTETNAQIEQRLYWADSPQHKAELLMQLLADRDIEQAIVFTSTQIEADEVADRLGQIGHTVAALHGGMPQGRRNRVLTALRHRELRVLVATDVAARGIDVPTISHVINFGLPMKAEDYVHRIGRTGRAGRTGLALTLAERRDAARVFGIQDFTAQEIGVATVPGLEPSRPAPQPRGPGHVPRGPRGAKGPRWQGDRHEGARHGGPRPGAPRRGVPGGQGPGGGGGAGGGHGAWGSQPRAQKPRTRD
jgi:superfamily II DNA/RNA helicase